MRLILHDHAFRCGDREHKEKPQINALVTSVWQILHNAHDLPKLRDNSYQIHIPIVDPHSDLRSCGRSRADLRLI